MGCSPSMGNKLNGAQGLYNKGKTLLPGTKETSEDGQSDDGETVSSGGGETDGKAYEERVLGEKRLDKDIISLPSVKKHTVGEPAKNSSQRLDTQEISINVSSQRKEKRTEREDENRNEKRGMKKTKHQKNEKPSKKKEKRRKYAAEKKVDFPEKLVKAHQAAYGYLNPSIEKYEILLGLLDNMAHTQISIQPMAMFMALQCEKFNQGLETIVEEGEMLLKDHGRLLAWPSNMKNPSSSKPSTTEPPPDLLQQLLQYTVQRMRLVGQSVKGIGDTALEEAVDYFSSISDVLEKKLNAKRALEARLMQLLTRIEIATLQQPGPEDTTLFSEDSGISVESESLAGSDRQHHRRESCESTESNHTIIYSSKNCTPVHQGVFKRQLNPKIRHSSFVNSFDSTGYSSSKVYGETESLFGSASLDNGEGEEEDNNEGNEDKHSEGKMGMCPSSSLEPDHRKTCKSIKQTDDPESREMTLKIKDSISERIHFVSSQNSEEKIKLGISKTDDQHEQQWIEEVKKTPKRPLSATHQANKRKTTVIKQHRSRSAESLHSKAEDPTLLELERTQKELNRRLEKMERSRKENKRKQTLSGQLHPMNSTSSKSNQKALSQKMNQEEEKDKKKIYKTAKGPMKVTPLPSPPPSPLQLLAMQTKGNSVKKLIDTFSQEIEESKQFQESLKGLGPLKGVRKYGVPVIPGLETVKNVKNNDQNELPTSDNQDVVELDNLPPPPLEVLMDNSFENVERIKTDKKVNRRGQSTLPKTISMSQKLCTSMQSVAVLPSKGSVRKCSNSILPAQNIALHPSGVAKNCQVASTTNAELSNEEAASLYKQARKIIHLRYSSNSPTEKPSAANDNIQQLIRRSIEKNQGDKKIPETVPSIVTAENQSTDTPAVSRVRMLPSTPIVHRRLPSPPVSKKQPISSSPFIFRELPTPSTASQRTLPTTPTTQNAKPSCNSGVTYPFKAPSPPASPKVGRRSRDTDTEDFSSRVLSNACSVFCPASSTLFAAKPFHVPKPPHAWTSSGSSVLPRPWSEHGRLPTSVRGPQPFIRRSQSDRRPSLNHAPRAAVVSIAQYCGSEPAINTQGLEDAPIRNTWNKQLELKEPIRSNSHPDLCIVGQAIQ